MIYFIQSTPGSDVKIGFTDGPLNKRLYNLDREHGVTHTVLGTKAGGRREERAVHERFAEFRTSGEWFRCDTELLAFAADRDAAIEPVPAGYSKLSVEISDELNEKLKALAVKDKRTKMAYVAIVLEAHAAKNSPRA